MAEFTANFEAGVNGATITTGAGEASATKWSAITGTNVYDSTHPAHGTLAGKMASSGAPALTWTGTFAADHYGRFYLYTASSNPSGDAAIFRIYGGGQNNFIAVRASGVLLVKSAYVGSVPVALGQWIRIEYHFIASPSVGLLEVKLFNSAESAVASETISAGPGENTGNTPTSTDYANFDNWSSQNIWYDDIIANATSYPGPWVAPPSVAWLKA